MPANTKKTVYPVAKFAFLALLLLLGAILLRMSVNFLHTIVLALFLGTVFIRFHYWVTALIRKIDRCSRKFSWLRFSPSFWLGRKASQWQERCAKALAHTPPPAGLRRGWLQCQMAWAGKIQRQLQPPRILRARAILEHRQRFTAGLSVALLVILILLPTLLFFTSAISQGMPFVNRGLEMVRSGELQANIVSFSRKESTKQAISRFQNSRIGQWLRLDENQAVSPSSETEDRPAEADLDLLSLIDAFIENTFTIHEHSALSPAPAGSARPDTAAAMDAHHPETATNGNPSLLKTLERPLLTAAKHVLVILRFLTVKAFATAGSLLFNIFLMVVVTFFVFYKGRFLYSFFRRVSPFDPEDYQKICENIANTSKVVFIGLLGAALVQGLASLFGFWLVGVPAAFFLAVISSFCAIIPFVGTALVWVPVAVYLLCAGRINAAIFICAWGILVVANIDGLVRPWLMSGGKANLSFGVLFFAILGGLQTYGLLGIVYGPILAGIFITCLSIFAQKYKRS